MHRGFDTFLGTLHGLLQLLAARLGEAPGLGLQLPRRHLCLSGLRHLHLCRLLGLLPSALQLQLGGLDDLLVLPDQLHPHGLELLRPLEAQLSLLDLDGRRAAAQELRLRGLHLLDGRRAAAQELRLRGLHLLSVPPLRLGLGRLQLLHVRLEAVELLPVPLLQGLMLRRDLPPDALELLPQLRQRVLLLLQGGPSLLLLAVGLALRVKEQHPPHQIPCGRLAPELLVSPHQLCEGLHDILGLEPKPGV
mmetsp:Transcript_45751/g.146821  ORF Transcript_45751/g.146821 Transcript_45751/m.146821 type:complete len:249 (+) Transcript_45751:388-1134(+)